MPHNPRSSHAKLQACNDFIGNLKPSGRRRPDPLHP